VKSGWSGLNDFLKTWKANRTGRPGTSAGANGFAPRRYVRHTSDLRATVSPCNTPSVIAHLRDTDTIHGAKFRNMNFAGWSLADLLDLHSDDHAACVDWGSLR
jgi:hypothetical protein